MNAMGMTGDDKIWTIGAEYNASKLNVGLMYLKGDNEVIDKKGYSETGWVAKLGYAGAKEAEPGTAGIYAQYYDQGASTVIYHTMCGDYDLFEEEGFKGYMIGANYTVAKNIVATVEYYDLKGKETDKKAKTLWSQLVIRF